MVDPRRWALIVKGVKGEEHPSMPSETFYGDARGRASTDSAQRVGQDVAAELCGEVHDLVGRRVFHVIDELLKAARCNYRQRPALPGSHIAPAMGRIPRNRHAIARRCVDDSATDEKAVAPGKH